MPESRILIGTFSPLVKFLPNQDAGSRRRKCTLRKVPREACGQQVYIKDQIILLYEQYSKFGAEPLIALLEHRSLTSFILFSTSFKEKENYDESTGTMDFL